ncbi:MAG: hypothetical protein FWG87_12895 [Defluviitaleaceae bacterium]|nr:hypothetical protein [Defluviitaleaceae bacterium]
MNYQFISLRYYNANFQPTRAQQDSISNALNEMATKDNRAVVLEVNFVDGGVDFVLYLYTTTEIKHQHIQRQSSKLINEHGLPYYETQNGDRRLFKFHKSLLSESL